MQLISGPVGHGCDNKNHSDVALVQAILVLTERPTTSPMCGKPYLAHYDGSYGKHTDEALRAFQHDHVFVAPDGKQPMANPKATPGRVDPDDATWQKLVEKVAADFRDLRVLSGGKTVYLPASLGQLSRNILAANTMTFAKTFRPKVIACINRVFARYGIAVGVCTDKHGRPSGARRDFQKQYKLLMRHDGSTKAGPGESNHNFGQAVDLGFQGLHWLRHDGTVVEDEDWWMHRLNPPKKIPGHEEPIQIVNHEALQFWLALRSVGTEECGLFISNLPGDYPHLQSWDDNVVDMADRLADLLMRVGKKMKWKGEEQRYECDLGLGGELFKVGTAEQIWSGHAPIDIAPKKRAAVKHTSARKGVAHTAAATKEDAKGPHIDVKAKQKELRLQFELADANWEKWTAK